MPIVDAGSGTRVDEIAAGIWRISTPVPPGPEIPAGFTFNRFLIVDEAPLLYHTGLRRMFPLTLRAIGQLMPVERLRYIAFSHFEADECGALNDLLAVAPAAEPLCGDIAAMVSVGDTADRPPRALSDGEAVDLGLHRVTWISTPHLPHAWECGHLFESATRTLFCGDLFTQFGADHPPLTEDDILEPSERARLAFDYYSHTAMLRQHMEKLAACAPTTLACMHGPAWRGDGAALLRELGDRLSDPN